ncbi:MAG: acyl-CoA/acyl-ACP dehydrogenase [Chloroflexi bacterium]|nr:acyl-CoA/acyl-ACP dehydrogenase [Chloroflexota bacterium]
MDFKIPEELVMIQNLTRQFVKDELVPMEKLVEETGKFPEDKRRALRQKAIDLGLYTYHAPVELGGGGIGMLGSVLIAEECAHVSQAVGFQGGVIGECREDWLNEVNEPQKQKYLIPFLRGESEIFLGLTEPGAGSDNVAMETRAVKQGKNWVINGTKTFITMADRAGFGLVWAVTDPAKKAHGGISCFIVEKGTPGYTVSREIQTFGRRGLDVYELNFDNCVVPEENLLGELGHGLRIALSGFVLSRLRIAAFCIGAAERAHDMAMDYAKTRVTFGKTLAQRQMVQNMLVDNAVSIHAARMMNYNAASDGDEGKDVRVKAMMSKVFASEMSCKAVDNAMQIHGGYGYSKDLIIESIYRDVRLFRIAEGATEMAKSWIASKLLGIKFE